MLHDVGGWARYRAVSAEFAHNAGYLNSVWNLGLVDAPVRYGVKLGMALLWTLGPCLLFVPRGMSQDRASRGRPLPRVPARPQCPPPLGSHLLVHFGVPGYAFHYVPALLALAVLGIGHGDFGDESPDRPGLLAQFRQPSGRLATIGLLMAGVFRLLPHRLRSARLARELRPVVRTAHEDRAADADARPPARELEDGQLAGHGGSGGGPAEQACAGALRQKGVRGWGGEILLLLGLRSLADSRLSPPFEGGDRGGGTGTAGYMTCRLRVPLSRGTAVISLGLRSTPPPPPSKGGNSEAANWSRLFKQEPLLQKRKDDSINLSSARVSDPAVGTDRRSPDPRPSPETSGGRATGPEDRSRTHLEFPGSPIPLSVPLLGKREGPAVGGDDPAQNSQPRVSW